MKYSKKATSLIEAIIIMVIVTFGVVGVYDFFISSERLADNTAKRIEAIQIAREGLEAITNIRNTNWMLFSADYENCWNTQSYQIGCIGDSSSNITATKDITPGNYTILKDTNHRWQIDKITSVSGTQDISNNSYKSAYIVKKDTNGFYNQDATNPTNTLFTREIIINYGNGTDNSNDSKMNIESKVQWWGGNKIQEVILEHTLTNWKNKS